MKIKILQWNIWFKEEAENVIELIRKINPDILCLQELTIGSEFNNGRNVPETISKSLGIDYNFAPAHKFEDDHVQGNGIFSKHIFKKNLNFFITNSKGSNDYSSEGRVCAVSQIQLSNKELITLATTHSSYSHKFIENESKSEEVKILLDFFSVQEENFLFTGDLNVSPNSKTVKLIEEKLVHCGPDYNEPTWTTKPFSYNGFEEDKLRWRLDYAFATQDIKICDARIIETKYSDHLPILLEVEV